MNSISTYEAFEIRLQDQSDGRLSVAIRSPSGEVSRRIDEERLRDLGELFPAAERADGASESQGGSRDLAWVMPSEGREGGVKATLEEKGMALYETLFSEDVERLFEESLEQLARSPHKGLCLRLHFDLKDERQAELARFPWELLYRDETRRFLSQSVETPIVRYLEVGNKVPRFKLPTHLEILLVVSEPRNLPALEGLGTEVERIRSSWEQDNVSIHVLRREPGASEDLGSRLRELLRKREFHILHFMGHGTFDEKKGEGALFLETAAGEAQRISGETFANWLINHRSLRLLVLNACSTGRADFERPFSGVAPALVRAGIPGVLAMQAPMPDRVAVEFGRVLYNQLADGSPVEAALAEARLELQARSSTRKDVWATPMLFQSTPKIVEVPPKIGPALATLWSVLASVHFAWIGLMFWRNRSVIPFLDNYIEGSVAAAFGIIFGLPQFLGSLYCVIEFAKAAKLRSASSELGWVGRAASRLPVAFGVRVQGHVRNEIVYKFFFFFLFVLVPAFFHWYLFGRMILADVWVRRESRLLYSDWQEKFWIYFTPSNAFLDDRYRLGSIDTRPGIEKVLNNMTYVPFWQAWGLLLAEVFASVLILYLLWKLVEAKDRKVRARS